MAAEQAGAANGAAPDDGAPAAAVSGGAQQANGGGGFSLSFASGAARRRPAVRGQVQPVEEDRRELVAGFTGGRLAALDAAAPVQRVIPRLENTFRVTSSSGPRKFDPSRFLPERADGAPGDQADRFELAAPEAAAEVTYGLQTRAAPRDGDPGAGPSGGPSGGGAGGAGPSGFQNTREWEAAKLRDDVQRLPDVASADAYEAMPVEAFGEAMMRGMGWVEGRGIGRHAERAVEAVEFVPRPPQLGLGATPSLAPRKEKRVIRQGETRGPKPDLVYINAEGVQKNVKTLDAKLVEREKKGAAAGKTMRVVAGAHAGLLCEVLAVEPQVAERSQRAAVRLQPSAQAVSVRVRELGERWESPAAAAADADVNGGGGDGGGGGGGAREHANGSEETGGKRKHKDRHRHKERHRERDAGADGDAKRGRRDVDEPAAPSARPAATQEPSRGRSWLAPHIMVKVVDKSLSEGRRAPALASDAGAHALRDTLYLRKAEVVDVPAPGRCSLLLPETGESVADVREDQVETVVPRDPGARVLVVAGRHRGQRARLLSRSGGAGVAAVQLAAELDVVRLGFDEISLFVGEAGEDE